MRINPMHKTKVIVIMIAAAVLLAVGSAQTNQTTTGPVGRYQLLSGENTLRVQGANMSDQKYILRIDTATGKASEWINFVDGDIKNGTTPKVYSYWKPIDETMVPR